MKVTGLILGLAASVLAAPAPEVQARNHHDLSGLNNLQKYNSQNIQYLNNVNNLDLNLFNELGDVNNFNVDDFQVLFQSNSFNLQQVLLLQQLQTLLQFANLGLFNGFDLSELSMNNLDLGLVNNVGQQDLSQFIEQSQLSQIQSIAGTTVVIVGK